MAFRKFLIVKLLRSRFFQRSIMLELASSSMFYGTAPFKLR
jgi:hypothetical protein